MSYFLIRSTEDGICIDQFSRADKLLECIEPHNYGSPLSFLSGLPRTDSGYWIGVPDNAAIVIKGDIIVPQPVKVALTYSLE